MFGRSESILTSDDIIALRRTVPDDLELYYSWYLNPEIQKYMSNPYWDPGKSLSEFRRLFMRRYLIQTGERIALTICRLPEGEPIGQIILFEIDRKIGCGEIGILIGQDRDRRHGYAFRALRLLVEYSSRELGIRTFYCHILKENEASQQLFERSGFVKSDLAPVEPELVRYEFRVAAK